MLRKYIKLKIFSILSNYKQDKMHQMDSLFYKKFHLDSYKNMKSFFSCPLLIQPNSSQKFPISGAQFFNYIIQMDFIAFNCNLGIAVKQALTEIVYDQDGKKNAESLYKQIFISHYNKLKQKLPEAEFSGKVFSWKEYPDDAQNRQYFQALIYQPQIVIGKDKQQHKMNRYRFARIEAMEPEGHNQKKHTKPRKTKKNNKNKRKCPTSPNQQIPNKKRKLNSSK